VAEQVAGLTLTQFQQFVTAELEEAGQVFGAFGNAAEAELAVEHAKKTSSELRVTKKGSVVDPFQ
jgi:hypothetical protein